MKNVQRLTRFILAASLLIAPISAAAEDPAGASTDAKLLDVLRSDAPSAEKAITCKKLAIHGSAIAVPDLAKLLPDPELSS